MSAVFILWLRRLKRYFHSRARMIGWRVAVRLSPLSYGVGGLRGALNGGFAFGIATDFAVLGLLATILLATGAYLFSKIEV